MYAPFREVHGLIETIPTRRASPTLIGARPTENHVTFWAYLTVFGFTEWAVFISLLVGFVIVMTMVTSATGATNVDIKDGSLSAISTAFLFTLQLGEHKTWRNLKITSLLTLTLSMLTMLFWIYYSGDITALMTAGKDPPIPVNNFEDVLELGYKLITNRPYFAQILNRSKITANREVYYKYLQRRTEAWFELAQTNEKMNKSRAAYFATLFTNVTVGKEGHWRWKWIIRPMETVRDNPDTLIWALEEDTYEIKMDVFNALVPLDLDKSAKMVATAAHWLQNDSEFLQIFNHYIMKMYETGVYNRMYRRYFNMKYRREEFSLQEPEPLGGKNVLFLFNSLGIGIFTALGIAFVEYIHAKRNRLVPARTIPLGVVREAFQ